MKSMGIVNHDDDPAIPRGFAAIAMNDSGWVGTNNGWPMAGQPALFPESQARAICYAWNSFNPKKSLCNLKAVAEDIQRWWL